MIFKPVFLFLVFIKQDMETARKEFIKNMEQAKQMFSYNIFLIGFMGSGKSTISKYLKEHYGMEKIEMDKRIEEQEGMRIADIFRVHGEPYFRDLETKLLMELQQEKNKVVSCGGGTPMREENVRQMKTNGRVVLLLASPQTIYERVKDSHDRPLLEGHMDVAYIADLMQQRREKYEAAADLVIHTDGKDQEEICKELVQKLLEWEAGSCIRLRSGR